MKNPVDPKKRIEQEVNYIAFLEKRLASANYKKNVPADEYQKTEEKLKKAKLVLRMFK